MTKLPTLLRALTCLWALALCGATPADERKRPDQMPDSYIPVPPSDDTLYQALGGRQGLIRLVADFRIRLLADPRLAPYFRDVDETQFRERLVVQFCEVSGGPCKQAKHNMKRLHSGVDINKAAFNAVVEVLQQALDAQGVAFHAQNRLLAQLAPMHRDIVNVR
ncbi:MAG: group 1 truncated hemoglobin [Burkholderiaceae bacterium]|nr:group 1 truncated hemoglobin [Burkholderiaceae bacterium]